MMNSKSKNFKKESGKNKSYQKGRRASSAKRGCNVDNTSDSERSKRQDIAWYNQYPALTLSSCQVPFNNSTGMYADIDNGVWKKYMPSAELPGTKISAPGVLALDIVPTIGDATDKESAVNVASRALYTFVRHVNSGHTNYDAPDLMMYLVAMDSLVMYHEFLKRIYGVLALNHPMNRYLPKGLCKAMGVDYDDMMKNMPGLLFYINNFATRVSSMVVPATIPLFERHKFLFSGVYADADNLKSQMYLFRPSHLWVVDAYDDNGTTLVPIQVATDAKSLTYEDLCTIGDTLINKIAWNEDFNIMSGDILKAFGMDKIRKFETIGADYQVLPVPLSTMPMFEDQINNAVIMDCVDAVEGWKITQNPEVGGGEIIATYTAPSGFIIGPKFFLNTHNVVVGPEQVMEMTRLCSYVNGENIHAGSEIVVHGSMVYMGTTPGTFNVVDYNQYVHFGYQSVYEQEIYRYHSLIRSSAFRVRPIQYVVIDNIKGTNCDMLVMGDINNFTAIGIEQLQVMHDTAILSEFVVPNVSVALK